MDYRGYGGTPVKTEYYRPMKQEPGAYGGPDGQGGGGQYGGPPPRGWHPEPMKREMPDQWQHGDRKRGPAAGYPASASYDDGGGDRPRRGPADYPAAVKTENQNQQQEPEGERGDVTDDTQVWLDTYNSDLNLIIDKSLCSATPLTNEGFAFMWAGARANYGVRSGKVCFEVRVVQHLDVSHLPPDEINPHVVRVGFSCEHTSMQLGEEPLSYGYGGTGKMSTNCQFKDYGTPFCEGDVVTCFVKMDSDPVEISFAKNGRHQGIAYRVQKSQLGDRALYPHILSKNCTFEVNFGQRPQPWFPLPQGYTDFTFINCVPLDKRERGTKGPTRKEDCEMIMMVGLPGCGKTTWATEYCKKHPEKKYNILGTNNIIDKMKVMGLPRKRNYHGRWDVLIDKSTKSLNKMLEMGSRILRNYILDQTNVYPTARRRKMKPFVGFKRKAVVIVPTDEEFRRRCAMQEKVEGKEVPDSAVLEMKANFTLPEVGQLFDEVEFVELSREEAEPLVKWYNEEGRAAAGSTQNRFRPNDQNQNQGGPQRKPQDYGGPGGNQWSGDRQSGFQGGRGMGGGGYRDPGPAAGRGPPPPRDWPPQGSPRGPGGRGYDHGSQPPSGRDSYGGRGGYGGPGSYEGNSYGSQGYGGRDQWDQGYGRSGHGPGSPQPGPGNPGGRGGPGVGRSGPSGPPENKPPSWDHPVPPRSSGPGSYDSKGYSGPPNDRYGGQRDDKWGQRSQDYGSSGYGQQYGQQRYGDQGMGPPQRYGDQGGYGSQQYGDRYSDQSYGGPSSQGQGGYGQQDYGPQGYGKSSYDQGGYGRSNYEQSGGYGKSSYEPQGYGKSSGGYDQGYGGKSGYDQQGYGNTPPYAQDNAGPPPPANPQWSQGKQWGQVPPSQSQQSYGQYYGQGYGGGGQWK